MSNDIMVLGYGMTFSRMTNKLKESNIKSFEYLMLFVHVCDLHKGFKVKRINKPNSKGTKVRYEAIKDEKDLEVYKAKIQGMVTDFNEKYGMKITLNWGNE